MDDYSQPDFYRFNQDSLELIEFIINQKPHALSILDLGAGSGIIGIELARRLQVKKLTLLELQSEYEIHLKKNADYFLDSDTECKIIFSSFGHFKPQEKFSLIVSNPPYYLPGKGEVAKDSRRALARSFLQDSWEILLQKIATCLLETGRGFLVLKGDQKFHNEISGLAKTAGLEMTVHPLKDLLIIEVFTLNKN